MRCFLLPLVVCGLTIAVADFGIGKRRAPALIHLTTIATNCPCRRSDTAFAAAERVLVRLRSRALPRCGYATMSRSGGYR